MNKKGFTLIELLITIAIIGILAGVAVTAYVGTTRKATRSEAYSNLESLRLLEEQFFADEGEYTASAADVTAIRVLLPGFQPGTGRSFDYAITQNFEITGGGNTVATPPTTAALTPCFVATATGVAGSRVCPDATDTANCDVFAIDCNNNRNF